MNLNSVLGQDNALAFLRGVIRSGRYPNAFLFEGPPGVGKGFSARAFALEANETGDESQNQVYAQMLEQGDHPEIVVYRPIDCYTESELARRRSEPTWRVGKIREILEEAQQPVLHAKRRFLIFEDFDKMPSNAASIPDAFLKPLEDGVPKTTFIFCTPNPEALPGTFYGRVTRLKFASLTDDLVMDFLSEYQDQEHFELACKLGLGSLDKARAFLNPEDPRKDLSGYDLRERALKLFQLLHVTPPGKILSFILALSRNDLPRFWSVWKTLYRDLLLLEEGAAGEVGLINFDREEKLLEILSQFDGDLASGAEPLRKCTERLGSVSGINPKRQIQAALLDFRTSTRYGKVR